MVNIKKNSKTAKLIITDYDMIYGYKLQKDVTRGLYYPKALDGICYVSSYNSKYINEIKNAVSIINKTIGVTFSYTDSLHTADIVFMDYSLGKKIYPNIYTKEDVIKLLNSNDAKLWVGVAFSGNEDAEHFMIAINNTHFCNHGRLYRIGVIIHELGHCIGIGHSEDQNDIMYAYAGNTKMSKTDIKKFKDKRNIIRSMKNMVNSQETNGIEASTIGQTIVCYY